MFAITKVLIMLLLDLSKNISFYTFTVTINTFDYLRLTATVIFKLNITIIIIVDTYMHISATLQTSWSRVTLNIESFKITNTLSPKQPSVYFSSD